MDNDFLKQQLFESKEKISPLSFLNDQAREDFWGLLDNFRDVIDERINGTDPTLKDSNAEMSLKLENVNLKGEIDQ